MGLGHESHSANWRVIQSPTHTTAKAIVVPYIMPRPPRCYEAHPIRHPGAGPRSARRRLWRARCPDSAQRGSGDDH